MAGPIQSRQLVIELTVAVRAANDVAVEYVRMLHRLREIGVEDIETISEQLTAIEEQLVPLGEKVLTLSRSLSSGEPRAVEQHLIH